jgi:hypothetical protein
MPLSFLPAHGTSYRSIGPRFIGSIFFGSLLVAVLFAFVCVASAQNLIVDSPTALPVGGTVNLGTVGQYGEFTDALAFHFDQSIKITAVSYDAGLGGAQELTAESLVGSSCFYNLQLPAGSVCRVETGIQPKFPGLRTGTLRLVTTSGTYLLPVSYTSTMAQAAVSPGTLTATVPGQTMTVAGNALALDAAGNIYVTGNNTVTEVNAVTGVASVVAGTPGNPNESGDGGPATSAMIQYPFDVAVSPAGDIYIVSSFPFANDLVRKVQAGTGTISTVAGILSGRPLGRGGASQPGTPADGAVAVDEKGNIFASVPYANELLVTPAGGSFTYLIGGSCNLAPLYAPTTLTVSGGYVYFYSQNEIFKISTDISQCQPVIPVAGTGAAGNGGDGGLATAAQIGYVSGLAVDAAGNVYLADTTNNVVRFVSAATGTTSSIAGTGSALPTISVGGGFSSLALDARGDLYLLSGIDGTAQRIDVSIATLQFVSTIVGNTSADSPQAATVSNIGNAPFAAGTASVPTGFGFDAASTCLQSGATVALAHGASCGVGFDFTPGTPGTISGSSTLFGETVLLSGTATAPASTTTANVSPTVINFGTVTEGNVSGTWTVNVANTGSSTLTLAAVTLSDTTNFVLGGNCGAPVPAYSSCNLTVTFKPQTSGAISATLTLTDNATPGTQTIALSGTAIYARPVLNVSPGSINFGSVQVGTTSAFWAVNIANTGGLPMTLATNILTDAAEFSYTGNCGAVVAAYSSCNLNVVFTPQAVGNPSSAVVIATNATGGAFLLPIIGTGVGAAPPVVQLSPGSINFGSVTENNSSGTWTIYVGNTGGSPLTIGSIVLSDTKDFVLGGNCGTTVAAYSSCSETAVFKPQRVGTIQGTITFTDNAGSGTQAVSLTGKATKPNYKLSVTPSAMTIQAGDTGRARFLFEPVAGFTGSVTLACAGLPASASCQFSPASITSDGSGTAQTAEVVIVTASGTAGLVMPGKGGVAFASLLGLNFLLFGWGRMRRKASLKLKTMALVALVSLGLAGTGGCGVAGINMLAPSGTQAVGMTATTNGTAGTDAQTTMFTLTITR